MFLVTQTKGGHPPQALIDAMEDARKQAVSDGGMISTGGLAPADQSARATLKGGALTVIDGPFAEAKELVGGYAIMEHPSREAAVEAGRWLMEMHQKHWPEWEGWVDVHPMFEADEVQQANGFTTRRVRR
jgi:hypothetical protein